ncbi:flavin reductase [Peribacillus frigoritolerans]
MDGRELRNCFGKFPTGVTIVSRFDGSVQKGITVNSFTSVSLDPPRALVSFHKEAKACTSMKDKAFTIIFCWMDKNPLHGNLRAAVNRKYLKSTGITRGFRQK